MWSGNIRLVKETEASGGITRPCSNRNMSSRRMIHELNAMKSLGLGCLRCWQLCR